MLVFALYLSYSHNTKFHCILLGYKCLPSFTLWYAYTCACEYPFHQHHHNKMLTYFPSICMKEIGKSKRTIQTYMHIIHRSKASQFVLSINSMDVNIIHIDRFFFDSNRLIFCGMNTAISPLILYNWNFIIEFFISLRMMIEHLFQSILLNMAFSQYHIKIDR